MDKRMIVTIERSFDPYFTVTARPYYVQDGALRSFQSFDEEYQGLADLEVAAQGNLKDNDPLYAWRTEYHEPMFVDLKRTEAMVKTLRRVERRLNAMTEKLGYPDSFAHYLVRVGDILGILAYGVPKADGSPGLDGYLWLGPPFVQWNLEHRIKELRDGAKAAA